VYVKVLTFELSEADRTDGGFTAFIERFAHRNLPPLREFGLLDGYVVRASHETIMTVNFYEDEDGAHNAFATITGTPEYAKSMRLKLLEHQEGEAYDLPLMGGERDPL
jgi:hypothetical protein